MQSPSIEFEERFSGRQGRWTHNLEELASQAQQGGPDAMRRLPGLRGQLASDDPSDALRWSILLLWLETAECYILGQFQSAILTGGAVLERILKLEYRQVNGSLPKGLWPLGKCIFDLKWSGTRITEGILTEARGCISPRNSRAHALLEHHDPQLAMIGGNRGVQVLSESRYLIEPFRNDALDVLKRVWAILEQLYGPPPKGP